MPENRQLLRVLTEELRTLQSGGYGASAQNWRPRLVFEDSPTCLRGEGRGCTEAECPLISLVPPEHHDKDVPCRHIRLNQFGETIDSLYRTGTQEELEHALAEWLWAKIKELETTTVLL
jgi:hypothetical protein